MRWPPTSPICSPRHGFQAPRSCRSRPSREKASSCYRHGCSKRLLPSEPKPIIQWFPVRLHLAAAEIGARVVLLGDDPVAPGAEAFVQLVLERPIAAAVGDRFVLRDTTAQRTIGGGTLLDLRAPSRKRRTPERLAPLPAWAMARPARVFSAPVWLR